jgi:two-component system, OmpR family, alkaline phosphatase synthesis response regulator PhoP
MLSAEVITLHPRSLLLVEDDTTIADLLAYNLRRAGYEVIHERDGRAGLEAALCYDVDLVLLDLMLPELDGMTVSREISARRPGLPIIMLTARTDRETVLEGFQAGAADYVTKPFDLDELLARIAARLRRANEEDRADAETPAEPVPLGDVVVDSDARVLRAGGCEVALNPKEHDLLQLLLSDPGHLFHREEIMQKVWHQQFMPASRTLDVHVRLVRVKLEVVGAPLAIHAVRGVGYRVVAR